MTAIERSTVNEAIEDLGELVSQAGGEADDALDVFKDLASAYFAREAVQALDEIDALCDEVLDQWTWPIRDFDQMRSWLGRLSAATARGRGQ